MASPACEADLSSKPYIQVTSDSTSRQDYSALGSLLLPLHYSTDLLILIMHLSHGTTMTGKWTILPAAARGYIENWLTLSIIPISGIDCQLMIQQDAMLILLKQDLYHLFITKHHQNSDTFVQPVVISQNTRAIHCPFSNMTDATTCFELSIRDGIIKSSTSSGPPRGILQSAYPSTCLYVSYGYVAGL
ncbi:uncharacterized protein LOC107266673 [Cephus cinctus]|uniref:Uncharacterized protein LOC107266673 n=1 Tax=Cephus cinctus TaxID=211228 RepID=A0AAJ7RF86_CEPCN|nr:uncharacterized protein LOC107266673 [Cephus cinctus]